MAAAQTEAFEHFEHTDTISMFHHRDVTVFALRPHEECQHDFQHSKVISAACLPCSLNVCFYFDHNPEMPPHLHGWWVNVDVQHAFSLDFPPSMQRNPGEDVLAWCERCSSNDNWQPTRTGWATDEQFRELCKSQMVATYNQILYLPGVHGVVKEGFYSADDGLRKLAPHIQQFKRFQVVATLRKTEKFWAKSAMRKAIESAITCWQDVSERWGIFPKPCMTAVWCVETVAVALIYNPNTHTVMLQDSHPYNPDCGASVHYAMGCSIESFVDHAYKTTFRTENLNSEGVVDRKGKRFEQVIELVMSDTMAQRYRTHQPLLPLNDIFKMFLENS